MEGNGHEILRTRRIRNVRGERSGDICGHDPRETLLRRRGKNSRRWENGDKVNDDFRVNNQISIIADSFCIAHASRMKYITWIGQKWKIESVDISYPRIIISIGGVWNGSEPEAGPDEAPDDAGDDAWEQTRLFSAP